MPEPFAEVGEDTTTDDGYRTPQLTPKMINQPMPPLSGRPNEAFGDVLVNAVERVSVSGATIANIDAENEDCSTHRARLTAAVVMKVAPKFVNLADESGRLILDNDPIITEYLTAIVVSEAE